ncbi:unnamed protein product [Diabrotica balteata]|uniref:L-2-hydroxyglutarate dehydrogenase, mitochondrial n=1 Tax=Diabrotica balteata TaxID=107213 RepID=A0A9N9XC03_DIABA|nr:unnamed protein product [Diabrotica balteata]
MLNFWKETAKQIFKSNTRRCSLHIQQNASCKTFKDDIPQYEATVIGGGIIGTAIARQIKKKNPNLTTALIEKEGIFGKHQSRNNSGVIHCGIYYRPGSLKSVLCQKGIKSIYEYCEEKGIPYTKTGKLIVANDKQECKTLNALYERGLQNKVEGLKRLDTLEQILEKEPMCKGFKSIWCANTGNVDFEMVTNSLGPTAVPAYTIEGYNEEDINLRYLKNTLTSPNFLNMTRRYISKCISQVQRHLCPETYIKKLQKLADFNREDVSNGPIAVQTQLINPDGTFQDDFVFEFFEGKDIQKRIINCLFLPSPAATSCLAIAEYVTEKFFKEYDPKT